ncbi:Nn.00g117940.m01.CDS01 [Neocucurbitaria sp. VM-36]
MTSRVRKHLSINEKDYKSTEIGPEDPRRGWVSKNPFSVRNRHPQVAANMSHTDFNHLKIPTPTPLMVEEPTPMEFNFSSREAEAEYLNSVRTKLAMAKTIILEEQDLAIDPDRPGAHKTARSMRLAEPPIKIDLHAQQMIRMLLDGKTQLKQLGREKNNNEDDPEMVEAMNDYWVYWTQLRAKLAWQIPGKSTREKEDRADGIMDEVLWRMVGP